jgi:penicillin-binding protein 1A
LILGAAGGLAILYYFGADLPDYQQLAKYEPAVLTRFYANDGRMYAEYAYEKRLFVPVSAIPQHVIQAFISAEDKNFYHHIGIDPLSILSAAVTNISRLQEAKRPIGASTITQQVARNFLLTSISTQVSLERKIKEAILAFRIEQAFNKDHILELYLNDIYLGSGCYGVAAAALHYFNKSLNELTIGEAAYLAALPKAPNRYHPLKAARLAKARRDYVLRRMFEDGVISRDVMEREMTKPIELRSRAAGDIVRAEYFAEEVRRELLEKYGEKALYKDGMVVRTTLSPELQKAAAKALRDGLIDYDRRHGWRGPLAHVNLPSMAQGDAVETKTWLEHLRKINLPAGRAPWQGAIVLNLKATHAVIGLESGEVGSIPLRNLKWARKYVSVSSRGPAIQGPKDVFKVGDIILVDTQKDPVTGEVVKGFYELCQIPQVSGALLAMDPHSGRVLAMQGGFSFEMSQFNRATQAMRQTGSAFKTFVYLTAFERGLTPVTKIDDAPFHIHLGPGLGVWSPRNYEKKFWGLLTLRRAYEISRNTVTVRLTHQHVGMKNVVETAKRFGIIDNMPLQLAMVLGAGETTLLKMVRATAMIANGGKEIHPTFIDRIQDRHGKTVFTNPSVTLQGRADTLHKVPFIQDNRRQVTDPASAYQMVSLMEGVIARGTGRVLQELGRPVAGKSGTTNDFKDAWFIAFTPDLIVGVYIGFDYPRYMGMHESGGRLAAPVVKNFLKAVLMNTPPIPFRVPPGIKLVRLNPYTGRPAAPGDPGAIWEAFKAGTEVKQNIADDHDQGVDHTSKTPDENSESTEAPNLHHHESGDMPHTPQSGEGGLGGLY